MINYRFALWLGLLVVAITGCGSAPQAVVYIPVTAQPEAVATVTPLPTDLPVVARVNGQPISEAVFQRRMAQLQAGYNGAGGDNEQLHRQAINGLIKQALIDQSAQLEGITVSDEALKAKIEALKQEQSVAGFEAWLQRNNLAEAEFGDILRREMVTAALYEQVVQAVPCWAEQIHARQIVVSDLKQAEMAKARLAAGELFADLALEISEDAATRVNGGDLGWFPQRVGAVPPAIEAAVFALPAGQVSEVLPSEAGYYVIKVELKDPHRALTPEHRRLLQAAWFEAWLNQQLASAKIEQYAN